MRRRYRSHVVLICTALTLAACGIAVTGLEPLDGDDGGTSSGEAGTVNETGTGDGTTTEAAPPPPDCHVAVKCANSATCMIESCVKSGTDHFADFSGGGGKVTLDAGTCLAVSADKQTSALHSELANLPLHYAYRFNTNMTSQKLVNLIIFGPTDHPERVKGFAFVTLDRGTIAICRTTPGLTDGGRDCPAVGGTFTDAGVYYRVSGEVDRRDGGKATLVIELADSPTSCREAVRIEVAGPYEDRINYALGCTGASCTAEWEAARFEVEPLP